MSLVNESQPASPLAVSSYRYPTGWFVVAWSSNVALGDVKRLHYFGRELVRESQVIGDRPVGL
jgi:hypothetical protein